MVEDKEGEFKPLIVHLKKMTLSVAIGVREGEKINEAAFKELIRAAVAANAAARAQRATKKK